MRTTMLFTTYKDKYVECKDLLSIRVFSKCLHSPSFYVKNNETARTEYQNYYVSVDTSIYGHCEERKLFSSLM